MAEVSWTHDPWLTTVHAATRLRALLAAGDAEREAQELARRVLLSSVDNYVALLDLDGRPVAATSAAVWTAGLAVAGTDTEPVWWAPIWRAPADGEAVRALFEGALAGRAGHADVELSSSTGAPPVEVRLLARPVRAIDGEIAFVVLQTSRSSRLARGSSRGEAEIARQYHELGDLRQRLVADLVHDLRAPLLSLAARGERLAAADDDAMRAEGLDIRATALSTLEQLDDLADPRTLLERRTMLKLRTCDVAQTLRTVAGTFDPVAAGRGSRIDVEADEPIWARVDEHKVTIILTNLIANAIGHAGDGATVRAAARLDDGELVLEVDDDGPGIARGDLGRVFERTSRRPRSRRLSGRAGMGLPIAREMAELHGGAIEAGASPDGGARITARIPYEPVAGGPTGASLHDVAAQRLSTQVVVADLERALARDAPPGPTPDA